MCQSNRSRQGGGGARGRAHQAPHGGAPVPPGVGVGEGCAIEEAWHPLGCLGTPRGSGLTRDCVLRGGSARLLGVCRVVCERERVHKLNQFVRERISLCVRERVCVGERERERETERDRERERARESEGWGRTVRIHESDVAQLRVLFSRFRFSAWCLVSSV